LKAKEVFINHKKLEHVACPRGVHENRCIMSLSCFMRVSALHKLLQIIYKRYLFLINYLCCNYRIGHNGGDDAWSHGDIVT